MLEQVEKQLEKALERALRDAMKQEQASITVNRYLYGDLTANEGSKELMYQWRLIENWQLGDASPFGDVE